MTKVAVLGGGVGGLSAAHELAERGYEVTVYEARETFGGKARSMPVPDSGVGGRLDLPGEHGFRFFPGFYVHLTDTMERIPHRQRTVARHLVPATRMLLAQAGGRKEVIGPMRTPSSIDDLIVAARFLWDVGTGLGIPPHELALFYSQLLTLLISCDERRFEQWEKTSWWDFTGAERRTDAFKKFLADGMTRTLVAARGREMSARTGGLILWQLLFDMVNADRPVDRVLDGPTSEVWIDPWVDHLRGNGVVLRANCVVAGIGCERGRISEVAVEADGRQERIVADHYIAALPVERLRLLISPEMRAADPALGRLKHLETRWMNGVMFYLDRDVPLVHGHAIFIDSEWSLTAISQKQFWPDVDLQKRGDGRVDGILSVDVSEWERPGRRTGQVASACSKEQIRTEVWGQLVDHIDDGSLDESNVVDWFLDPAIEFPNPSRAANAEPLLINTPGSWPDRPRAVTEIPNFFLAADFVRTHTDLATMESANEAARRAVNGILDATGSTAERCRVSAPREPRVLGPLRALDRLRWRLGRPPAKPPVEITPEGEVKLAGSMARGLLAVGRMNKRRSRDRLTPANRDSGWDDR